MNAAERKTCAAIAKALSLPVTAQVREFAFCGEEDAGDDDRSTNCTEIDLARWDLEGDLDQAGGAWSQILKLPYLEILKLNHNDLQGFPQQLPSSLEQLYLHNNEDMGGSLPPLKNLRRLAVLWASSCALTGPLPYSVG